MDRYIVLENGMVFKGQAFGADKDVIAELVFTTSMTTYLENLTDPSYYGQAVMQTFPLLGNYGVMPEDAESGMNGPSAYIVREWCPAPSNFRSQGDIDTYMKKVGIPGVCGIDTRALTRIIRENGVMNVAVTSDPATVDMEALKAYRVSNAAEAVSSKAVQPAKAGDGFHVVLMDFGAKNSLRALLTDCGFRITTVPCTATAEDILAAQPDGIVLSDGPGDPAENTAAIAEIAKLVKSGTPVLGICLGHQLLALANGFRTEKLKYGHRGANQPAKDLKGTRTYITAQNTGFTVVPGTLPVGEVRYINANDQTIEGIDYPTLKAFSVQFRPETVISAGKETLFDRFIALMGGEF